MWANISTQAILKPRFLRAAGQFRLLMASPLLSMARVSKLHYYHLRAFSNFSTPESLPIFDESEGVAMAEPWNFMGSVSDTVTDLECSSNWDSQVLKATLPVVVLCHQEWCPLSQDLVPLLDKKVLQNSGKMKMVKVNIDSHPEIAEGLQIQSTPTTFLVAGGKVIDTFFGLPTPERLDDFINTATLLDDLSHEFKAVEDLLTAASEQMELSDYTTAISLLTQCLKSPKFSPDQESRIYLTLALCFGKLGDTTSAQEYYLKWESKFETYNLSPETETMLSDYHECMHQIE